MSDGVKKVRLHYGGETFDIHEDHADLLVDYTGKPGAVRLNLGNDKFLTLAVGPGIPILVEEYVHRPATVGRIR